MTYLTTVVLLFLVGAQQQSQTLEACNFTTYPTRAGCLCSYPNGTVTCIDRFKGGDLVFFPMEAGGVVSNTFNVLDAATAIEGCTSAAGQSTYYSAGYEYPSLCKITIGFCNPGRNVACCKTAGCSACQPYYQGCSTATQPTKTGVRTFDSLSFHLWWIVAAKGVDECYWCPAHRIVEPFV